MSPRFAFGLLGYAVIAAFLDDYDRDNRTPYTWYYTALIWLVFLVAHRAELAQEVNRLRAYWNTLGK